VIALVRYVWVDTLRSQRWVAPLLCFGAIDAIISAQSGSALPSYAIDAAALLFITTWLTVVIVNNEDPIQQKITEVCAGSSSKVRLSKLVVSLLIAVVLGVLGMIAPTVISSSGTPARDVVAGLCAQFITALMGVTFGAFCSRPIVPRRSMSVLLGVLLGMATVLVPHAPPTRQLLVLFNESGHFSLGRPVLLIFVETVLLSVAAMAVSLHLSQRKT
jgi:magnesium-transporting ATPase (P-type)